MTESIFNSIRILPREDLFLTRNVGNSGQVFFNKDTKTLQVYDGTATGGYELASENNIIKLISQKGIASYNYIVTVTGPQGVDTGDKYNLNGVYSPALTFVRGYTYVFNQSDPTNLYFPNSTGGAYNLHPISFSSDDANGDLGDGSVYGTDVVYLLDNVQVTRSQYISRFRLARTRHVIITARETTPDTLYYFCSSHTGMGNTITVSDPGTGTGSGGASIEVSDTAPTEPTIGNLWLNTTNGILYVYQSGAWIQPSYEIPSTFTEITTSDSTTITPTGLDRLNFREGSNIEISTDTLTNTITFSVVGDIGGGVDLTAFSVGAEEAAAGDGGISYDNTTGVFTYTPPDLSSYATTASLASYATTASLASYATTAALADYASLTNPTFTDGVTVTGDYESTNGNITLSNGTMSAATVSSILSVDAQSGVNIPAGASSPGVYWETGGTAQGGLRYSTTNGLQFFSSNIVTPDVSINTSGDLVLAGNITTAGSGTPELASDNEILLTATTYVGVTQSPFRLASLTQVEIDALTPVDGDMVMNATTGVPQIYVSGAGGWNNMV
jgi:hypothetical protein